MAGMSGDETLAMVVSAILAVGLWGRWFLASMRVTSIGAGRVTRAPLWLVPLACFALLWAILRTLAAHDVRDDMGYLLMYALMGAAWVGLAVTAMPILGISPRDDAVERSNPAAMYAIGGGLVGLTLCFAGSNIGDGPGWWVVVFCAVHATVALLLAWAMLSMTTNVLDAITIDRDTAAGIRMGAFLIAAGSILGRSVAGDWITYRAAIIDFLLMGWPVTGLVALAIVMEHTLQPRPHGPQPSAALHGLMPALLYLACAAMFLIWMGPW
jgi:uncharacterized membrane protein YjfL (UPF0719 family)